VVINKYNLSIDVSNQIKMFCQRLGLVVLGEIPYDHNIPKFQSDNLIPVEVEGKSSKVIKSIYKNS